MSWLHRLWNTFRPERVRSRIERELSFHIAERTDQLRAEGLSEQEAARLARRQLGNVAVQAERTRDVDIALWADGLMRNVRYSIRTLTRTPGFTVAVVLTLGLGIGANTAVFSAINAVLLRPLSFPDGDRLMQLRQTQERTAETNIAPVRLEDWHRLNSTFEAITGYYAENESETSGDLPEKVKRAFVTARFFDVWGVAPALGRGFTADEHQTGGAAAVVISDRYWHRRFGADPNVAGKSLRIGSTFYPIVGVMPASFLFPDRDVDLWFPARMNAKLAQFRAATWYIGVGRLKPGVTPEQARANLAAVQAQLAEQYPETDRTIGVEVTPLKEVTVSGFRSSLWLLFGAVSVLLLITCTNIAALLLSRAAQRTREIAVRLSLGASRASVAAQLLTETGLLALAGSAVGLLIAAAAASGLRSAAMELPRLDEIALDGRILLYTVAVAVTVTLLCGLLPAIRTARGSLAGASNDAGRRQVSTRNSLQWLLVGTQVALSITLLAGAGLLVRSFQELSRVNRGFDAGRVLTFRVSGNWAETVDYARLVQRIDGTLEALRALPGVASAATAIFLPGVPAHYESIFQLVEAGSGPEGRAVAEGRFVSPDYFATMGIPVVGGERCSQQSPGGARDVMVNRAFVGRYLAGRPAVGLHLATDNSSSPPARIVGVVGDARERGLDRDPGPIAYTCFSAPTPTPYFLVRTHTDPAALAQAVRLKMKELEPSRAVYDIAPLEERIGDAFTQTRLRTILLVAFALTALSLACVGLYGTLSYVVNLRRREVGLRLALGAARTDIVRQFLMQGLRVAGLASICGLALSIAFTRTLSSMLYGVSPSDPATLAGVITIVLIVASLAALVPATRAALVEPSRALREE